MKYNKISEFYQVFSYSKVKNIAFLLLISYNHQLHTVLSAVGS